MRRRALLAIFCIAALTLALAAEDQFAPPRAFHAKTYPAHDEHPLEKVSIAADPYDMPDKAQVFSIPFKKEGLLPIRLLVSNDGEQPIALAELKVELITVNRIKITPADTGDIYRKIAKGPKRPSDPRPIPIPLPRGAPKPSVKREYQEEIEAAQFRARAVGPGSTEAGFFFFDIEGLDAPLAGARLYITGLRDEDGQELMYFEIPMEKYLTYRPPEQ